MGERHLRVKLIAKIDMVEEVASQLLWQETIGEGALATTLLPDEDGCHLIAMERIEMKPMSHGRTKPSGAPSQLFARDAGDSAKQCRHMILAIPPWQVVEIILYRIIVEHCLGAYVLLYVLARGTIAAKSKFLGISHDGVQVFLGEDIPCQCLVIVFRDNGKLCFTTEEISSELIVLLQKGFY